MNESSEFRQLPLCPHGMPSTNRGLQWIAGEVLDLPLFPHARWRINDSARCQRAPPFAQIVPRLASTFLFCRFLNGCQINSTDYQLLRESRSKSVGGTWIFLSKKNPQPLFSLTVCNTERCVFLHRNSGSTFCVWAPPPMAIPSTVKALECIGLVTPWGYIC